MANFLWIALLGIGGYYAYQKFGNGTASNNTTTAGSSPFDQLENDLENGNFSNLGNDVGSLFGGDNGSSSGGNNSTGGGNVFSGGGTESGVDDGIDDEGDDDGDD